MVLNWAIRVGLTKNMVFEQIPEVYRFISVEYAGEKCLICSKNSQWRDLGGEKSWCGLGTARQPVEIRTQNKE